MNERLPDTSRRVPAWLIDVGALALIAAFVLLFFWRIWTPNQADRAAFPPGDFTDQFWAFRMYEARAFAEGRLPLWSGNYNSGHPFLADVQSAIFYPIGLLFTLGVVALRGAAFSLLDLELETIVHFILAGAFTYLLARRLLASRPAAFVSALTFTFGGYLTSYPPQQLAILETATWLPLALLLLDEAVRRGGPAPSSPEDSTKTRPDAYRKDPTQPSPWQGEGEGGVKMHRTDLSEEGKALSSSPVDDRGGGGPTSPPTPSPAEERGTFRLKGRGSTPKVDSPFLLGKGDGGLGRPGVRSALRCYAAAGLVLGVAALAGHPQTFMFVLYACILYWAWRVYATDRQFRRRLLPLILTLALGAGISAAQMLPTIEYQTVSTRAAIGWAEAASGFPTLDPLQMILPGFASAFQSPLYVGVLPLWLALVALLINRSRERVFWAGLALGSLVVSFGAYVFAYAVLYLLVPGFALFRGQERLAFIVSFSLALLAGYGLRELLPPSDPARARRAFPLLPAGITISLVLVLMLYVAAKENPTGRLFFLGDRGGLMVLLFLLATVLAAARLSGVLKPNAFTAYAIALIAFDLFSVDNAAYNADPQPRYPVTPIVQAMQSDTGVYRVADEGKMPGHFGIAYRLDEIGGISPLRTAAYDALLELPPENLWPLLNVRYVITGRPGFANADVVMSDGDTRLLRLTNTVPRAWIPTEVHERVDDDAALQAMANPAFNPAAAALVADALPFPAVPNQALTPVEFVTREPEHLVMTFSTPTDSMLMLSEVYYPGWSATVDGVPTPILRADVALRAVPVRAGQHRVDMVYDPWSVKIGIGVTLATLFIAIVAISGVFDRAFAREKRRLTASAEA